MRSGSSAKAPFSRRGGILIICRPAFEDEFFSLLDEFAISEWKNQDCIKLCKVPEHLFRDSSVVVRELERVTSQYPGVLYSAFIHGVAENRRDSFEDRSDRDRWEVKLCGTDVTVFKREIRKLLAVLRLDWISSIEIELTNFWQKGRVDRKRIERWLSQFGSLRHPWVGERLLRILELWSGDKLLSALDITPDGLEGFDRVCCITEPPGQSGSYISHLIKRPLNGLGLLDVDAQPLRVESFHRVLQEDKEEDVLLLEDCLVTGTEMQRQILGLLDAENARLQDLNSAYRQRLSKRSVQLRFGVATDLGRLALTRGLQALGLSRWEVCVRDDANLLPVLTESGRDALRQERLWAATDKKGAEAILARPLTNAQEHISPYAFRNPYEWGGPQKYQQAISFCKRVGRQLFIKGYIDRMPGRREAGGWSEETINESGLGVRSLGLVLAFSHSIPKASLPLFWAGGEVELSRKAKDRKPLCVPWEPLFPDAA